MLDAPVSLRRGLVWRLVPCLLGALLLMAASGAKAQPADVGGLRVTVRDATRLPVEGAQVTLRGREDDTRSTTTNDRGVADFDRLPPGRYDMRVDALGFDAGTALEVSVRRGARATRDISLTIASFAELVDVTPPDADQQLAAAFNTELSAAEIDALPEDPDELIAALLRRTGGDADVRIDGFADATLPEGTLIQSVRIRYDGGSGSGGGGPRIEIRTEPGGDRWRSSASARLRDETLNARNAFAAQRPTGQTRVGSWSLNGPLVKHKTGLSISVERSQSLEQQAIRAAGPGGLFSALVRQPNERLSVSARLEQALTPARTLRIEVRQAHEEATNQGLSEFDLPERAVGRTSQDGELRVSHNQTLRGAIVHDSRLQVRWRSNESTPASVATAMRVPGAFGSGGAQQQGGRRTREFEYEDELMLPLNARHQITSGVNVIGGHYSGDEWRNAGGTFTFASLDDLAAGRPTTFTQRTGDPSFAYSLYRFGEFLQDDYRVRKNVMINLGIRHEFQTHLSDWANLAPRLGVRWTPSARFRTSLSGNLGVNYQPLLGSTYEQTLLVNGQRQRDVVISAPAFPDPFAVSASATTPAPGIVRANRDLMMPSTRRLSLGLEQPMGKASRLRLNYQRQTGQHLFRSLDANAPVDGVRPDPSARNITELGSTARSMTESLQITLSTSYQPRRLNTTLSYTLGEARNETDGPLTLPPDSVRPDQEWGPSRQDVRHRFDMSFNSDLWLGFRLNGNLRAQSAAPYTITTGLDANGDGVFNERPVGVGRNSVQGAANKNVDVTLTWGVGLGERHLPPRAQPRGQSTATAAPTRPTPLVRFELYAQANNVFNTVNLQNISGVQTSPFFGRPTSATAPRRVTIGVRASF